MIRASKYRNKKTNGYDSKKEAQIAADLKILANAGEIQDLREQVEFELFPKRGKMRPIKYRSDFVYYENGNRHVVDVKGYRTDVYKLKKRMMLEILGIEVEEL